MKFVLLSVHGKFPSWVSEGIEYYQKKWPKHWQCEALSRPVSMKSLTTSRMEEEGQWFLRLLTAQDWVVVLDPNGQSWTSEIFAQKLELWEGLGKKRFVFIVGGPDGLDQEVKKRADVLFSLSSLTLPHGLVGVFLMEVLYRSWAIRQHSPYHKA